MVFLLRGPRLGGDAMIRRTLAVAALATCIGLAAADDGAGTTYHFGMHPKYTNITFVSEADIENIYGITHTAKGTTWLDFDTLTGKCSISVPVKSLDTGIPQRNEHLQTDQWLHRANYP